MLSFLRSRATTWPQVAMFLVVCAAFVVSHQFTGVRHDGILYAGDALARILPAEFSDDSYFRYGSQGRFTLLPAVYAALIMGFGVGGGTIVGLLIAFALYLAASTWVISALAPKPWRVACLLSLILGWTIYGGVRVFAYSEPFLTARSFAEPIVLLAIGLLLRDRVMAAIVALAVALLVHPLIAVAGLLVAWLMLVQQDRRWLGIGVLGVVVLGVLGIARVGPFADLFTRYDATWLALVHEDNPQAFVLQWSLQDYGIIVFNVVVLGLAVRCVTMTTRMRQLLVASVVAGVGATLVSLVTVDFALNPFFGKLQVWRAEWILQWLAMATFPLLLGALWKRGEHGRVAAGFLALGWLAPFSFAPAILGSIALVIEGPGRRVTVSKATTRLVFAVVAIAALTLTAQHEVRAFRLGALLALDPRQIVAQAVGFNLVVLAIAFGMVKMLPRIGLAGPLVALILLAGAFQLWDQRTAWTRTLEGYRPGQPLWKGLIEPTAKVYWYRDLIAPWVLLGHANYYTPQQGSGAVFSRDMTIELDRRSRLTGMLDLQEQICRLMNNLNGKQSSCEPDKEAVKEVCKNGGIDYVVLQSRLEGAEPLADMGTGVVEEGYEKRFFLYRCSAL